MSNDSILLPSESLEFAVHAQDCSSVLQHQAIVIIMSSISPAQANLLGLFEHYCDQTEYNPLLSRVFNTTELSNMFWVSLDHDIQLISQRSQNLEDHEISLTQKAFKLLHSEDKFVPAANIYVELILGLGPVRLISE